MASGLVILAEGMITGVGLNAAASCAAIRCGLNNFRETRFMSEGEWIIGSEVPLEQPWRGTEKLVRLASSAIEECIVGLGESTEKIPLYLCLAEEERPGRLPDLDDRIVQRIQTTLGVTFSDRSTVISRGTVGGAVALTQARMLMEEGKVRHCLIAGADTYLVGSTLSGYGRKERLLTPNNSDGFIPGEAGGAVLVGMPDSGFSGHRLICLGLGFGREKATIDSDEPLCADGLVESIRSALGESGLTMADVDYRICDANGEQYGFKEASLALARTLRTRKERFEMWHPADSIGAVGAATLPCYLGIASTAAQKGYAPGKRALSHMGNDSGERAALILSYDDGRRHV